MIGSATPGTESSISAAESGRRREAKARGRMGLTVGNLSELEFSGRRIMGCFERRGLIPRG